MTKYKNNIYDKLIVFFITLQVFGGIGGPFQPIRFFVVFCIPLMLIFWTHHKSLIIKYGYEFTTFGFWIVYGVASLLWVIVPKESIKEIIYLFINFLSFFLLITLANKANNPKESIIKGWIVFFIATLPIAFMELAFDRHLSVSFHAEEEMMNFGGGIVMQRFFASVTYGNLNGYNTILTYVMPFLFGNFIQNKNISKRRKVLHWALLFILSIIIIINSSRAALGCLLIAIALFLLYNIKSVKTLIGSSVILVVAIIYLISSENLYLEFLLMRFKVSGVGDEARSILITSGLKELINTGFMGIGAADFSPTMKTIYRIENSSPHNLFLEILVQYGIIVFLLFVGLFIRIVIKTRSKAIHKRYKFIVVVSLLILPISSIINSSYILAMWTWLFFASLYIIADDRYEREFISQTRLKHI